MKWYAIFALQFAFRLVNTRESYVAVFANVTDIVSGCSIAGCYQQLLEARLQVIAPRFWTIGTPIPQSEVISEMIKLFRNYSTSTLKVLIYNDCITATQKADLYKELENHSPILRHVRWIILSESELPSNQSWSSKHPSLSCDAVFVSWPFLNMFDVSEPSYAAACPNRKKVTTASYFAKPSAPKLFNTTIRIGCRLHGSTRHCYMPLSYAVQEAFKLYSVRLDWTQNQKEVHLGVADDLGFFTGTLGELQNRTFDLYLVDLAQEWNRFQMFDYMKTTHIQSLTFAFALPASAPASAQPRFFSIGSLAMTVAAAFAVATSVILLKMKGFETRRFVVDAFCLGVRLVFLLFSQPLSESVTNMQKEHPPLRRCHRLKRHNRRTKKVPERRLQAVRVVLATWLFSSVTLVTKLQSSLISQLKYPFVTEPINSVAKLEVALRTNAISPCLLRGTGAAEYLTHPEQFERSVSGLIRRHIERNEKDNIATVPSECYEKMNRQTHVYVNFYTALKQLAWNGSRDVFISRDSLVTFFGSSAAPRGWPYTQSMRRLTSTVLESGLIVKHTKDADFRNSRTVETEYVESKRDLVKTAGSSLRPLAMLHFKIALCIFAVGHTLACLAVLLERAFTSRQQSRKGHHLHQR